ncbi:MAG: T9SS type A sorting domain-containing protein [Sphingobacteriales bacterium]|nr:MAG: T9SS type A sorting domain-containing protein [Sphingobacteriales bacterium]
MNINRNSKDRDKKEKARTNIEAIPNPAKGYTNVVISYQYNKGTATLYDLAGRQLQSFTLDGSTTIPVNLSGLPEGIYIVEIVTTSHKDAVKIINSK